MTGDPPPDDPTISDALALLRRINPLFMVDDGDGGTRLSSNAFNDMPDQESDVRAVSALVESKVIELGGSAESLVEELPNWGVVAVGVELVRACGLGVVWAPTEREGRFSAAHVHVFGAKSKAVKRRLVNGSVFRMRPG
jgi:hypothetical protein